MSAATPTPPTATHSYNPGGLIAVLVLVALLALAVYLLRCWAFPFTTCPHPNRRRAWRCRRCEGTGRRLRAGRRFLNHLRHIRRHGNHH
ncbi:hypothetical protein BU204_19320 [Actinophytocola xanthii]|uniref:Uncharacterized protein n=1 Tax=Actinophytocola xanthii TaxID=1912961 RepID=A0A1Q8CNL1_9PSEU|nr:hypothetical protein BU204_19320 [Actinophytocola xanthii]